MACGNSRHKTCNDKSCQRYYNNNRQPLAVSTELQLVIEGTRVVDTGVSIDTQNQSYTTLQKGLYHITGDVTVESLAQGDVVEILTNKHQKPRESWLAKMFTPHARHKLLSRLNKDKNGADGRA